MIRVALKALWWRKRRVRGVASAVFLGIAFLTGTQVLADTVDSSIGGSISSATSGTDAVVRNATDVSNSPGTRRAPIPASVLASVRATPGVADAVGEIDGYGQIVGSDGKRGPGIDRSALDRAAKPVYERRAPSRPSVRRSSRRIQEKTIARSR